MTWQLCIQYPNGKERVLRTYRNREVALKQIDAIYSQGYPMHVAYVVRPLQCVNPGIRCNVELTPLPLV